MSSHLKRIYDEMASPKWVIAFGACASSGGPYRSDFVLNGISSVVPVDIYIPGCPPRYEDLLEAFLQVRKIIQGKKTDE